MVSVGDSLPACIRPPKRISWLRASPRSGAARSSRGKRIRGKRKEERGAIRREISRLAGKKHGLPIFTRGEALGTLLRMAPLVLPELRNLEDFLAAGLIGHDETAGLQLPQHGNDVAVVIREQFRLDPQRPALQAAVAVCERPQANEQQPGQWIALSQELVLKK
jgi:hypothetical protein